MAIWAPICGWHPDYIWLAIQLLGIFLCRSSINLPHSDFGWDSKCTVAASVHSFSDGVVGWWNSASTSSAISTASRTYFTINFRHVTCFESPRDEDRHSCGEGCSICHRRGWLLRGVHQTMGASLEHQTLDPLAIYLPSTIPPQTVCIVTVLGV